MKRRLKTFNLSKSELLLTHQEANIHLLILLRKKWDGESLRRRIQLDMILIYGGQI